MGPLGDNEVMRVVYQRVKKENEETKTAGKHTTPKYSGRRGRELLLEQRAK